MSNVVAEARQSFSQWREEMRANIYDADPHLQSLLRRYGRLAAEPDLRRFGEVSLEIDSLAHENNRDEHLPRLRRWDDLGARVERVDFHPSHREIGKRVYGTGLMGLYAQPGREFDTLAFTYMVGTNGEAGHACPLACTAGLIKTLKRQGGRFSGWLERLYDPDYDTHFHGSQFLTEVQGGSDVGANALEARPGDTPGTARLWGEKWFCSVVDAQLMLVTARPVGERAGTRGVRAYAVPRHLDDGRVNDFQIRRLKFKLGTKTMASGEIDFVGAHAVEVGDFKDTVEIVLNTSRLYNAVVGAGMMQRAYREAHGFARHRRAFDRAILGFPLVARTVARLRAEVYGARAVTFLLADLISRADVGQVSEEEQGAFRMLVNLNKFWVSQVGTSAVRDAIEVLGGNGAIEEFSVLPRLLRDSIVCEQWEGPHNVLCAQVLRDSKRLGLHEPMLAYLERLAGPNDPDCVAVKDRWAKLMHADDAVASAYVRDVAEAIRPHVQALALKAEAAGGGTDPLLGLVAEHLPRVGLDALEDPQQLPRVMKLVS